MEIGKRPVSIFLFEILAMLAMALGIVGTIAQSGDGNMAAPVMIAVLQVVLVLAVSRGRNRVARLVWTAIITWLTLVLVVFAQVLSGALSTAVIAALFLQICFNIAALVFLWSGSARRWLSDMPA